MGKAVDVTPRKRAKVEILLKETNLTQQQIAKKVGVSQMTVSRAKHRISLGKNVDVNRVGRCGRKRKSTERDNRNLVRICLNNRKATSKSLQNEWASSGVSVSARTVRRRLVEHNLRSRKVQRKPKLTEAMITKRLNWAKLHKDWTEEEWGKVCFSDESTFHIVCNKSIHVRRRPGEAFHKDCIGETIKHPTAVMVWSVISVKGPGRLYIVENTMNQIQYKKVLETKLIPQLQEWFPDGQCIFMQDHAPCHTAKSITQFLNARHVPVLPWPGNSPDANPIENLWEIVKRGISKKNPTTRTQLIEDLISVWHHNVEIQQLCSKLVRGMPNRIKAILSAKGRHTKY